MNNEDDTRPLLTTKVKPPAQVLLCKGCCCGKTERGLPEVPVDRIKAAWKAEKLNRGVQLTISGCLGPCDLPNVAVVVTAEGTQWYGRLDGDDHYNALIAWARACVAEGSALPPPKELAAHRFDRFRKISTDSERSLLSSSCDRRRGELVWPEGGSEHLLGNGMGGQAALADEVGSRSGPSRELRLVRWSIQVKMITGFGSALGILVIIATLSYLSTRQALADRNSVSHAFQVMAEIQTIRSLIADAETGQRGYLITGDESFLSPYVGASGRVLEHLGRLEGLVAENPIQKRKTSGLRKLIVERFELMGQGVRLRDELGYETTQIAVSKGRGRTLMEQIRRILTEMSAEESRQLNRKVEAANLSVQHAKVAYTLLILLDIVLLVSVFHLIRHDIAERTRTEQLLRQSRERFEVAVQGSRDGLWDWDLATNDVYFSPRWKEQLGYADHEMGNRYEEWESRVHPDDRDRALATIRVYLEGEAEHGELEHRLRHKDGTYRWVLSRAIILRDERGTAYRLAGSTRDITPRKQSEKLLLDQNRRLEESALSERKAHEDLKLAQSRLVQSEKLVSLGQMVAGVAHEINNPLGFVINNIAVLQRDVVEMRDLLTLYVEANELLARERPDLHARVKALSDRVDMAYTISNIEGLLSRSREGLRRIHQIVKDLRAFARLDEGEIKEADLNPGIESAATMIRGNARNKQVEFEVDLDRLPAVTCNPAKINQVVMNLLSNAVDACPEGGKVVVRSRAEPGGIRIEVSDTGPGIDPTIRDRIFDPFFTTKPVGQGTGLGLSISYGIVQEHGGSIEVDTEPGRGTRMTVHLPLQCPPHFPRRPVVGLASSDRS